MLNLTGCCLNHAVSGLLVGSLTSGVQLAISQSNTGGARGTQEIRGKGMRPIEDKMKNDCPGSDSQGGRH
jgi:Na+/H+-translocating membrane pyrophosphatase